MRTTLALALSPLLATLASGPPPAAPAAKLRVVCTIGDLTDAVSRIGGERVDVTTICRGKENLHQVVARPSHLIAMSRADLFVQVGLSLETVFVPGLLEGSRNPRIQPGQPGFVNCSAGWTAIGVPASLSRQGGDVHPEGNPHMNLDPRGGRQIADRVLAALIAVDPASKADYERRHADHAKGLGEAEARWAALGSGWKGKKVVVYHTEYDYLVRRYGMEVLGAIEVRPGIPPTPNHLSALIERMRREKADAILTAVWSNNSTVARIASETGTPRVELPNQCGGLPGTDTWIGMMDAIHARLAGALGGTAPGK